MINPIMQKSMKSNTTLYGPLVDTVINPNSSAEEACESLACLAASIMTGIGMYNAIVEGLEKLYKDCGAPDGLYQEMIDAFIEGAQDDLDTITAHLNVVRSQLRDKSSEWNSQ